MCPWSLEIPPPLVLSPSMGSLGRGIPGSQLTAAHPQPSLWGRRLSPSNCSKGKKRARQAELFHFLEEDRPWEPKAKLPLTPTPWACQPDPHHRPNDKHCPAPRHEEHKCLLLLFIPQKSVWEPAKGEGKHIVMVPQGSQPRKWQQVGKTHVGYRKLRASWLSFGLCSKSNPSNTSSTAVAESASH